MIDCINNIGENIKNFQIKLKRLPHVDMNQSKPMEEIAPKLPKDQLNELLKIEKDISSKFTFLTGLLTNKVELPDKLFNTLAFLHIKFIDLINSNQYYLEQNICGEILTLAISLYKDKSSEFINTKLKYVDPLLKLSISMIDNVKIGLHNEMKYSTLEGILRLPRYHRVEKEMNEKAMELLGTTPATTLFVGDQLFTDVWGAKKAGIVTYLVKPIHPKEEIQIVLKRKLERIVLYFYHKNAERRMR